MTSKQAKNTSQHNHGMSNAAVLVIGMILGLVGAGAFIFINNQSSSPSTDSTTEQTQPAIAADISEVTDEAVADADAQAKDAVKPKQLKLTEDDVKQIFLVKQATDKVLLQQRAKLLETIKQADAIINKQPLMALDKKSLDELSPKLAAIIEEEKKTAVLQANLNKVLVKLVKQTKLSEEKMVFAANNYLHQFSPQTAMNARKASLQRWDVLKQLTDALSEHFGKWTFDPETKKSDYTDADVEKKIKELIELFGKANAINQQVAQQHLQEVQKRVSSGQKVNIKQAPVSATPADATTATPTVTGTPAQ